MARITRTKKKPTAAAQPVVPTFPTTLAETEALSPERLQDIETQLAKPMRAGIGLQQEVQRRQVLRPRISAAKELEQKRKPLRLRGRRSTIRTRVTPDIFASSLGEPKRLLGA